MPTLSERRLLAMTLSRDALRIPITFSPYFIFKCPPNRARPFRPNNLLLGHFVARPWLE